MVGSIIGVGVANQLMSVHGSGTSGVDWEQATKVFKVLLISPIVGFGAAALLFLYRKGNHQVPGTLRGSERRLASTVAHSPAAGNHLHRCQLLPWIE